VTLSPAEHQAHVDFFAEQIGPLIRNVMGTKNLPLRYDEEEWECFLESLTVNVRREILWGPNTRGPHCTMCDQDDANPALKVSDMFDPDHEFSPRDNSGAPPCHCGHASQYHSLGERGEHHPQYKAIEGFVRAASKDPDNPAYVPFAMNPTYIRGMWTLLLEFEKYRDAAIRRFKVVKAPDGLPG
jgi:hypothetical protein